MVRFILKNFPPYAVLCKGAGGKSNRVYAKYCTIVQALEGISASYPELISRFYRELYKKALLGMSYALLRTSLPFARGKRGVEVQITGYNGPD